MKIGQVAKKYHLSIDRIYFYINYGLIVPPRPQGQYYFDAKTIQDLEFILHLKSLHFSLKEIHKILSLYRVSNLVDQNDIEDLKNIYQEKKQSLQQQILKLTDAIDVLQKDIDNLNSRIISQNDNPLGVPIRMLNLIICPQCQKSLRIDNATINQCCIIHGDLSCPCGYQAVIREGILQTPNKNDTCYDKPDLTRELYKDLPPSLISLFQRSYNTMIDYIQETGTKDKVIMETHINAWFFMHNHLQYFHPTGMYIVVDKFPEMLLMYKKLIERQNKKLDILYIADNSTKLPIKKHCVDLMIDYFASNEHNFYRESFLLDELSLYFAPGAKIIGTYFYFDQGFKSIKNLMREYPQAYYENFNKKYFLNSLKNSGYSLLKSHNAGYSVSSGANLGFSFHEEGEKMYLMPYLAEKN